MATVISKKLRDFILTCWVYDNIYKNELIQLIDINSEIKKFKQDLERRIVEYSSNNVEIVDIMDALDIYDNDKDALFKKLDLVAQKMGEPDVYHLETLDVLKEKAVLLMTQVNKIFFAMKSVSDFDDAEKYFILLEKIQTLLSQFVFREGLVVSRDASVFIHDFDRLDDFDTRMYLFKRIRDNVYDC